MSYTRTITSNGNSISQEGGQSFNQQLDDLQEQIEEGGGGSITDLGTSSGTANALAGASLVDTATTFTAGRLYRIRTNAANSGAATCSINGGTGVAMKKSPSSAALASGDIADATELLLYYDGTNLQVLSGMTVSADEILTALGSGKWPVFRMDSVGGSANAITASVSGLTLTSGQYFWLVPASNSSSTTVNLNLNSGGNVRVKKADGSTDPASGDLQAGVIALLYYDGTYYRQMTGMPVSATDSTKVPLSTGTTKGDIITYTASGTVTRRAVGSSGQFLTPNSGNSDGLEYRALTPSDIPARRTLIATLASQTLAGGYNRLAFASATRNDGLFTVSSNVFTAVANCVVQVSWAMYSASYAQVHPVVRKNASNYIQASPSQISAGCYASIPVELSTGDTLEVYAYSDTGSIDLDISIASLNKLIIVEA